MCKDKLKKVPHAKKYVPNILTGKFSEGLNNLHGSIILHLSIPNKKSSESFNYGGELKLSLHHNCNLLQVIVDLRKT